MVDVVMLKWIPDFDDGATAIYFKNRAQIFSHSGVYVTVKHPLWERRKATG